MMKYKTIVFQICSSIPVMIYFNDNIIGVSIVTGCTKEKQDNKWSIKDKSIVLTNKLKTKVYENIKQDDTIVLIDPTQPNRLIARKVKGIAGDSIWQLFNDGDFSYKQRQIINDNYLWVESLSDRKENEIEIEEDSREYQQISSGLIDGVAIGVIWPLSRFHIY